MPKRRRASNDDNVHNLLLLSAYLNVIIYLVRTEGALSTYTASKSQGRNVVTLGVYESQTNRSWLFSLITILNPITWC